MSTAAILRGQRHHVAKAQWMAVGLVALALLAPVWPAPAADPVEQPTGPATAEVAPEPAAPATPAPAMPARKEPTVVTSERLQVDYAHNMGTFEGNVLAVDPRITVRADKMVVFFGRGTNDTLRSLQKIVAEGGVVITQGERRATGEHAEYTGDGGKVVLTGNPKVESAEGVVSGQRITFWHDQEKMEVEAGTQLIIHPDELRPKPEEPEFTPP